MFNTTLETIQRLGLQEDLLRVGFANFKLRHSGRYDLQVIRGRVAVAVWFLLLLEAAADRLML